MTQPESPAAHIEHTLLKPETTAAGIACLCEEAVEFGFAAVCVPPLHVEQCHRLLYGSEVRVATVVGFPFGYELPRIKALQTAEALRAGADEIDMVIDLGAARAGEWARVSADIAGTVAAAGGRPVKAIIECCLFDADAKRQLVEAVVAGGAAYVKTSTGFAASGATTADVALLVAAAAGRLKLKAAGGIRDWAGCAAMLAAGADRIGTSAGVTIMRQWQAANGSGG
ncbi:MAG: deoxyribose-phosphate aldolase [Desulfuromonadales bacterium]|nr:deoxyribose-phosphate aldolase [Desulfuromonadales bacterium]